MFSKVINFINKEYGNKVRIYIIDQNSIFLYYGDYVTLLFIAENIKKLKFNLSPEFKFTISTRRESSEVGINEIINNSDQFDVYNNKCKLLDRNESLNLFQSLKNKLYNDSNLLSSILYSSKICKLGKIIKDIDEKSNWDIKRIRIIGDKKRLTNFKVSQIPIKTNSISKTEIVDNIPVLVNYKLGILCQMESLVQDVSSS